MPKLLTTTASLLCPHGGQVQITSANARSKAAGAPLVRKGDVFLISGCPLNVAGAPHPCVTVEWVVTVQQSKSGGDVHLNDASMGLCKAGDQAVQGAVQVVSAQTRVDGR